MRLKAFLPVCSVVLRPPLDSDVTSYLFSSGWLRISMNMVGVPYTELHLKETDEGH